MDDLLIRPMRPEDWPRVEAIYRAGIRTGTATFETECPPWAAWDAARLPAPRLTAESGGRAIGWAALSAVSARPVYRGVAEVGLYVDPQAAARGVGTRLLTALIVASEAAGIWTLQSAILSDNEKSLRLHRRCGFRTVGVRERLGKDSRGVWRDVVLMERRSALE